MVLKRITRDELAAAAKGQMLSLITQYPDAEGYEIRLLPEAKPSYLLYRPLQRMAVCQRGGAENATVLLPRHAADLKTPELAAKAWFAGRKA